MSAAEHASFWSTEAKMISAASCNYNYCTSGDSWVYHDMVSRTRPEYSLPFPRSGKPYGGMAARFQNKASAAYSSGLLMEKPYLFGASLASLQSRDQKDCAEHCKINSLNPEHLSDDLLMENGSYFKREDAFTVFNGHHDFSNRYQPIEEPWLSSSSLPSSFADKKFDASSSLIDKDEIHEFLESDTSESTSHLNDHNIMTDSISQCQNMYFDMLAEESSSHLYERDQPLEEPWLLSSFLISSESAGTSISAASSSKHPEKDEKTLLEHQEQYHHISDKLLSDGEDNLTSHEKSFFTEILINSSVCTMQRIAILEDGKLVELLLEPVKTNVQCDSVYLGVVTKLVPNMGGAFVNIGNSRPSLMDIRHNREPFIFPPFASTMKGKTSSSICAEHSASSQSGNTVSDGAVVSEHDTEEDFLSGPVSYQPDDFEDYEDEDEDDVDAEEVQMGNVSCSVLDIDGIESVSQGITTAFSGYGSNMSDHPDFRMSSAHEVKEYEDVSTAKEMWAYVRKGTKIIVQVVKEGLGTKGPTLTAYPKLRSRFWVLIARCNNIGVSKKISGVERTRLKVIAKTLQPAGFGLTVRTVAEGHSVEELKKDLNGLLSTWRTIMEHAKSAALAADEGVEGAVPAILHQAMGQTLSVVQDYFNEKVKRMIVDSPRTYHEVTNYLQDIAPNLCDSVELHAKKVPLFDEFNIEDEINDILNKRVPLPNGGSLVIEQTEALVSIDVNGGHGMLGHGTSQEKAILDVNLAAAKKIARELRLRDIGGIIVVDFIDMVDESNKRLVYEEVRKAVERDRSTVRVSELSKHGLMEITRKRVRPSVTFMISEPCTCCHATGRVEASETSFSKIEHEICRLLAMMKKKADPENPKSWPKLILRVDSHMCDYLTSGKKTRLATLSSSLRVWILLKVARNFSRGAFEVRLITDDKIHNNHNQVDMSMVRPIETGTTFGKRSKLFPVKKWKTRGK